MSDGFNGWALRVVLAASLSASVAGQGTAATSWEGRARLANEKFRAGEFAEALRQTELLADEAERFEPDDPRRGMAQYYLGLSYHERGRHWDAARALEKAAKLQSGWKGEAAAHPAATWNHLGVVYAEVGEYAKAERAIREARRIMSQLEKAPSGEAARADLVETRILFGRGRLREAEASAREALSRERGMRPEAVFLWNILGNILVADRRWQEAEGAYLRALDGARAISGSEHANTARLLINLAGTSRRLGRAEEAESAARQAAEILARQTGADHPAVGAALLERAEALRMLKRNKEAKELARRGEEILARFKSENHVGVTVDAQVLALRGRK